MMLYLGICPNGCTHVTASRRRFSPRRRLACHNCGAELERHSLNLGARLLARTLTRAAAGRARDERRASA